MDKKDKKDVTIILNGTEKIVPKEDFTFDELVALAFPTPPTGENVEIVVMYSHGQSDQSGTLEPGGTLKVKDRMIIDVTPTDRS